MPDVTFRYNGATVTVREAKGRDVIDSSWILHDLVTAIAEARECKVDDLPDLEWAKVEWFIGALLRSTVKGKLDFDWPDTAASREDTLNAYEALMDQPAALVRQWQTAMRDSNLENVSPED